MVWHHRVNDLFADWQNAVIGLLAFAVAFGFLGTVLTVFGVITTTLTKKIYYYHSAGEIYFICGKEPSMLYFTSIMHLRYVKKTTKI